MVPVAGGEPLTFAQRNAEPLAQARPQAEVGVLGLPCGRALVTTEDSTVPVPGRTFGIAEDSTATVRQLQALLAHPDARHLVAAAFSTEDLEYWEQWLPIVAAALTGLSFYPPPQQTVGGGASDRIREAFG
ncbi:glycosyltransferase family 1 protein [Kitasatospora acidiphila]|uniref:Glycosyltransferase family 1 protein n=1 Tax=Kitasatospora acidiphila TaxID=2567942 RepID=A0A540W1E7_9ACTN|nr:glycosyltransferase family 1 protein [Kitasatospora acidiphila]